MWHLPYRSPSSAQRSGFHSVSLCRVFAAELLLALAALVAVLTRIDDTTDGDGISSLGSLNFASDFDDAAHNLMARHNSACTSTAGRNRLPGSRRKGGGCYEELAKRFEADGWIVGRVIMQSEDTSATRDPLKETCLAGSLGELVIKGPARLTALAKACLLLGRNSGFIGSRVEETEARINRKYRNSLRSFVKSA